MQGLKKAMLQLMQLRQATSAAQHWEARIRAAAHICLKVQLSADKHINTS